jgi:hypothetical protein
MGDFSNKPGIVSALVSLYSSLEDLSSASDVLQRSVNWYKNNEPNSSAFTSVIRANANFQLRHGDPKISAEMLEILYKKDPKDNQLLTQMIAAYSKFDQQKAQQLSKKLPSPRELSSGLDVAALEAAVTQFTTRRAKVTGGSKVTSSPSAATPKSSEGLLEKKHKKKKRKPSYPRITTLMFSLILKDGYLSEKGQITEARKNAIENMMLVKVLKGLWRLVQWLNLMPVSHPHQVGVPPQVGLHHPTPVAHNNSLDPDRTSPREANPRKRKGARAETSGDFDPWDMATRNVILLGFG